MTRVTIIYEGIDQGFGYIVEVGATEWEEGKEYPIVDNFNFDDVKHLVGNATDIRREDNNEITAEVPEEIIIRDIPSYIPIEDHDKVDGAEPMVFFPAYTTGVVMEPSMDLHFDPEKEKGKPRRVKKCVLRAVGRVPIHSAANPGAKL